MKYQTEIERNIAQTETAHLQAELTRLQLAQLKAQKKD